MTRRRFILAAFSWSTMLAAAGVAGAEDTPVAKADHDRGEEIALFDGASLDGWTTVSGKPVTKGWTVEDGALVRADRGGPIYTAEEYGDFQLDFEWKIATRGNSGLKYRMKFYEKGVFGRPGWLGCEYQLLDDEAHPNGKKPLTSAGALYALYAPDSKKKLKPTGQYNHSRIVVQGNRIEHWLNGEKIVEADTGSDDWKKRIAGSKFSKVKNFAVNRTGRIQLQDHGSKVWFRSITLRPLSEDE